MSHPLRIQYPDAYYHVICRGNEQREIFRDEFIEGIKEKFGNDKEHHRLSREQPALRELETRIKPEVLINQYAKLVQVNSAELTRKGKQSPSGRC